MAFDDDDVFLQISVFIHIIFSTKGQKPFAAPHSKERIWALIGDIARENRFVPVAVGGTDDHVHLLVKLPPTLSVDDIMRLVRDGTTAWVREEYPSMRDFAWQEGSASFSVGESECDQLSAYILDQQKVHRRKTFKQEYVELLKENQIDFQNDETLWD